ncbi:MAG: hypothetical protein V1896_00275 [Candidatus Zambryskibacteria bacterium]
MKTSNGVKNKSLLILVIVSLLILPGLSFAQSTASGNTESEDGGKAKEVRTIKDEIENKKQILRQEMASRTDAIKSSVQERRQNAVDKVIERINQFVSNIIKRYDAATNRLEILADRIDSRITKIESGNIDVSKAKELLTVARAKIEIAKAGVNDIASTTSNTTFGSTTATVKKDFEVIKIQIEKAKEDIRVAHAALIDVVENLKPGQNKLEKEN